jgi:RNA polymerase-binding transcription factor DksA
MLTKSDLHVLRTILEETRSGLLGRILELESVANVKGQFTQVSGVDRPEDIMRRDQKDAMRAHLKQTLDQVETALNRMDEGSYGRCIACHEWIPLPRLKAVPYTSFCVACQSKHETPS